MGELEDKLFESSQSVPNLTNLHNLASSVPAIPTSFEILGEQRIISQSLLDVNSIQEKASLGNSVQFSEKSSSIRSTRSGQNSETDSEDESSFFESEETEQEEILEKPALTLAEERELWQWTPEEEDALISLKDLLEVEDIPLGGPFDNPSLIRFLRARNLVVDKALLMVKKYWVIYFYLVDRELAVVILIINWVLFLAMVPRL